MNAGATAERVHGAIRRMILGREVRPGDKLDPAVLADALLTSATPVREALSVLHGEGLVDARPGGGFHVPMIDAPALADLYAWSETVIALILRSGSGTFPVDEAEARAFDIADATARLVDRSARSSPNEEHRRAVADINARLHPARLVEPEIIDGVAIEIARLERATDAGDVAELRAGWRRYHRRRLRAAPSIARALIRD
jgi:DNA-binding GntR family transcriptional regulator